MCSASHCSAELIRGFDVELQAALTGEEIAVQDDVWELQVQFKPMRMIWVDVTDARTGEQSKALVWYLVYRVQNVPIERPEDTSDTEPINTEDPLPGRPMFVPEFTLATTETDDLQVYPDVIVPEAQRAIERRERRALKNGVEIVGPIPASRPANGDDEDVYYGVAMWKSVDPQTDKFAVYMSGFSSAYQIRDGADGEPVVWRKTIVQIFDRPGDEYDEKEVEISRSSDPEWSYRPEQPAEEAPLTQ